MGTDEHGWGWMKLEMNGDWVEVGPSGFERKAASGPLSPVPRGEG